MPGLSDTAEEVLLKAEEDLTEAERIVRQHKPAVERHLRRIALFMEDNPLLAPKMTLQAELRRDVPNRFPDFTKDTNAFFRSLTEASIKLRAALAAIDAKLSQDTQGLTPSSAAYRQLHDGAAERKQLLMKEANQSCNARFWAQARLQASTQRSYVTGRSHALVQYDKRKRTNKGLKLTYFLNAGVFILLVLVGGYLGIVTLAARLSPGPTTRILEALGSAVEQFIINASVVLLTHIVQRYKLEDKQRTSAEKGLHEAAARAESVLEKADDVVGAVKDAIKKVR